MRFAEAEEAAKLEQRRAQVTLTGEHRFFFDGSMHTPSSRRPSNVADRKRPGTGAGACYETQRCQWWEMLRMDAEATVNDAEYGGLLMCLGSIHKDLDPAVDRVHVYGDSQLVVDQVNGLTGCSSQRLRTKRDAAQNLLRLIRQTRTASLQHVKRSWNPTADLLANRAVDTLEVGQRRHGRGAPEAPD